MTAPHNTSGRTRIAIVLIGSGSSMLLLLSILVFLIDCSGVRGVLRLSLVTSGVESDAVLFVVAGVAGVAGTAIVNPAGVTGVGVPAKEAFLDLAGV